MQFCRVGKKSKRFSPGSDLTDQIFARELSEMDSCEILRQGIIMNGLKKKLETCLYLFYFCKPKFLVGYVCSGN